MDSIGLHPTFLSSAFLSSNSSAYCSPQTRFRRGTLTDIRSDDIIEAASSLRQAECARVETHAHSRFLPQMRIKSAEDTVRLEDSEATEARKMGGMTKLEQYVQPSVEDPELARTCASKERT
jgi:hypothetical protein